MGELSARVSAMTEWVTARCFRLRQHQRGIEQGIRYFSANTVKLTINLDVPESQNAETATLKHFIAHTIPRAPDVKAMLAAIRFNN